MEPESKAACTYLIRSMEEKFSAKERQVADYILADPAKAIHPSMETLADHIGVSVSTLVRFVRKLGYEGYQQFRIALAAEALTPNARMFDTEIHPDEDPVSIACRSAARSLTLTESMIDRTELEKVATSIVAAGCVHLYG
ncbi:MAG: MurR/RpiR family transcriptional regulator, partial [Spirochaetales bacterium]|nr:MurR/RpiR family transcriptional regulator [Spirochaetales bacterium]